MVKVLDLGCGRNKVERPGATVVGVDNDPGSKADVMHDLNNVPYPFKDNEFDEVVCMDVLEHLYDVPKVINEIHRISKPGAIVRIRSPHFSSLYAAIDPTHIRPFSVFSFDCFCENKGIIPHNISVNLFRVKKRRISFPKLTRIIFAPLVALFNKFPLRYEQYLAFRFQAENIHLELEVVK